MTGGFLRCCKICRMKTPASVETSQNGLSESVVKRLRQRITDGEFAPGQRLAEESLSKSLDTSRNTLREAFRTLTHEGLVKHVPHRGVFVMIPTMAGIMDIYRMRRLIECQALEQAYPRHPAKKKMRLAIESSLQCQTQNDWLGVGTANMAFHMAVVELADSERLNAVFYPVMAELRLAFRMLDDAEFMHAPYVSMNREILELVESGHYLRAAEMMREYLIHSERIVLTVYARRAAAGL